MKQNLSGIVRCSISSNRFLILQILHMYFPVLVYFETVAQDIDNPGRMKEGFCMDGMHPDNLVEKK